LGGGEEIILKYNFFKIYPLRGTLKDALARKASRFSAEDRFSAKKVPL
jgi:hypothetical protein